MNAVRPLVSLAMAAAATAQWSPLPTGHLAVADGGSTQDQPKVVATADGGCYVSFYDSDPGGSPPFGYDVRIQRLDAGGREQWPHGGVLVADRGFSSTQDYGLAIDVAGNALLAFRDDRPGGIQVTAAKVDPTGALVWGAAGVQLTATTAFVAAPKIAGTSDGDVVVAWAENSDVHLQRLDGGGARRWAADVVLSPPTGSFAASDLHAADGGSVLLAIQHSTGGFSSPRHLRAQKLDAAGNLLWAANHVAVFDGGSLQIGNFPRLTPDGGGGAVFAWYSASPALECRVQHLDAAGNELFAHDGVAVSTDASRVRVSPSAVFDAGSGHVVVVYQELNAGQSSAGVSAQRLDAAGNRLWSSTGLSVVPLGTAAIADTTAVALAGGRTLAVWSEGPATGQVQLRMATLDAAGSTPAAAPLSSTPATKFRVVGATSTLGFAIVTWRDDGAGSGDVLAQDVLPDGSLGGVAAAAQRNGNGINPLAYSSRTPPALGTIWIAEVAHGPGSVFTATFLNLLPATGPVLPGLGEVLLDFTAPSLFQQAVASSGAADPHRLPVPADVRLLGLPLSSQALVVEAAAARLTNAIDIVLGL